MRILLALNSRPNNRVMRQSFVAKLSAREREIAALVRNGLSNKEIARHLGITEGTVKIHLHHIYSKLKLRNRAALAAAIQASKSGRHEPDFRRRRSCQIGSRAVR